MRRRPTRRDPERVGALVPRVLEDLGFAESVRVLRIAERWEEAVGEAIALHGQPTALRGEVLEITVDSSPWCQQLQLRRPELLAALRRTLGDEAPSDIWFRVGTGRAG